MKDLTVIIPLEKWDEEIKEYLDRALVSVLNQTSKPSRIVIATNSSLFKDESFDSYFIKTCEEFNVVDIAVQSNYIETGVKAVDKYKFEHYPNSCPGVITDVVSEIVATKYFTVLLPTDQFEPTWFENVEKYIETSDKEISIYLPICKVFNEEGVFFRFLNEQWWANGFSQDLDLGYVDEEGLKLMYEMILTGAVINKKEFEEIGGLKNNIKLYFWYEFLLRLVYNQKHAFVIPKSLYNHSYFKAVGITEDEARFYWDSVQKEYYFNTQRELVYNNEITENIP